MEFGLVKGLTVFGAVGMNTGTKQHSLALCSGRPEFKQGSENDRIYETI